MVSYNLDELKKIRDNPNDKRHEEIVNKMGEMTLLEAENAIKIHKSIIDDTFDIENKDKVIELKKKFDEDTKASISTYEIKKNILRINENYSPNPLLPKNDEATYGYYLELLVSKTDNALFKSGFNEKRKEFNQKHYEK